MRCNALRIKYPNKSELELSRKGIKVTPRTTGEY